MNRAAKAASVSAVTAMKKLAVVLLAGSLFSPALAVAAEPGADNGATEQQAETVEAVDVKLDIRAGKKKVGELAGIVVWDQAAELSMDVDGHRHVTSVVVHKASDNGRKLRVQLGYHIDGETLLETIEVDAAASRKKTVKSGDGKIAITLTLAPKRVARETVTPAKRKRYIGFENDSKDPLAGLD